MRIQHNILAMNAYRNYNTNTKALAANLEKLSSGYKINRAGDDAAGLAISEKMRAQIKGLEAASKNVKDGTSLVKTAEGAMQEIQDMLGRMKYLATQSANGTYDNEVDRKALQDEVNQLREEINRIADSANFNGIKLLNGKMGLNEDAFAFSEAAAVTATDGTIEGSALVSGGVHLEVAGNATQTAPAATIDLGNLEVKGVAAGTKATVEISIGSEKFSVELNNTGATAKDYTTAEIAQALKAAIQGSNSGVKTDATNHTAAHDGTPANNDSIRIGDAIYTLGGGDGTAKNVTLTFNGWMEGIVYKDSATTTNKFTAEQADGFNGDLGFTVSVGAVANGTAEGDVIHDAKSVTYAKPQTPTTMAGVDITLTADMIEQGNKLTIDGTTFVFQTDATNNITAGANEVVINVSDLTDPDARLHKAIDEMSKQTITAGNTSDTTRTWTISSKNGNTIHIDQTLASATGKELKTQADIEKLISFKGEAKTAANVGTTISVTDGNVDEGDGLTIDGKKYQFTDDADLLATTGGNTTYVAIKGGAAQNLANAIGASAEFDAANNTVTVRAATADDKAPVVLGKGLQLQIGDTSDPYNQMGVLVNDMHTTALGIDKLRIDDPESASAAIQTVMDAINSVSSTRGTLGAIQNRLDHTANNLSVMTENIQDAESTIRDTDVAEEMMAYTKNNILVQSAQAMLAQANAVPQGVLQLLG